MHSQRPGVGVFVWGEGVLCVIMTDMHHAALLCTVPSLQTTSQPCVSGGETFNTTQTLPFVFVYVRPTSGLQTARPAAA